MKTILVALLMAAAPTAALAQATAAPPARTLRAPDVMYVPTPEITVDGMLAMAGVGKNDVLYDLGPGDGRIPVTAAKKFGTRGVGIDINPERIAEANANARAAGVTKLVEFRNEDLFEVDISKATVVTLYLLPQLNLKLRPKLLSTLKPGTRIVSHAFDMGDWKPDKEAVFDGRTVYLWTVPKR
ncbi:MAG: SAM-dependent methyltransferase [Alphaproteobacteria bacterium]|nr:MAG: SAM-dependent methyltransferase [Alphaproteobacteria bacterium]